MTSSLEYKQDGDSLHAKVLGGNVATTFEIADAYLKPLVDLLHKKYPRLEDPHYIPEAVEDALLNYFGRPEQFDPGKGISLFSYLRMAADGDLRNLLQKDKKRVEKFNHDEFVELQSSNSELIIEKIADPQDDEVIAHLEESQIWSKILELFPNKVDQEIVSLIMDGEKANEVFADVLCITDLPVNEQRKIVKRNKDRIKKTIRRHVNPNDLIS